MSVGPRHVLVGLGNLSRGDDAAGRLVARRLNVDPPAGLERVPIAWNHAIEKGSLKIKGLEHVLNGKPLRTFPGHALKIVECEGEATMLLDAIEGAEAAWLVDACVSGGLSGAIHRFDATSAPLPDLGFGLSTHGFGLAAAIELARALDRLPPRCVVYAIEGALFDPGAPLSQPVAAAVAEVARRLRAEIAEATRGEDAIPRPPS